MKNYTSEEYLQMIIDAKTTEDAVYVKNLVFSVNSGLNKDVYTPQIPVTWSIFYALVEMEKKFDLDHFASAYCAIDLVKPKIGLLWSKKGNTTIADDSDFYQNLLYDLSQTYIDEWDPEKNDNFLAYICPELLTTLNITVTPEITEYIAKTRGYTSISIDELNDRIEGGYEIEDPNLSVEDMVIRKLEKEDLGLTRKLITIENNEDMITGDKSQIKNAIFTEKILGGVQNLESDFKAALEEFMEEPAI